MLLYATSIKHSVSLGSGGSATWETWSSSAMFFRYRGIKMASWVAIVEASCRIRLKSLRAMFKLRDLAEVVASDS